MTNFRDPRGGVTAKLKNARNILSSVEFFLRCCEIATIFSMDSSLSARLSPWRHRAGAVRKGAWRLPGASSHRSPYAARPPTSGLLGGRSAWSWWRAAFPFSWCHPSFGIAARAVALAAEHARPEAGPGAGLRGGALIGQGEPLGLLPPSVPFFTQFGNLLPQQPVFSL